MVTTMVVSSVDDEPGAGTVVDGVVVAGVVGAVVVGVVFTGAVVVGVPVVGVPVAVPSCVLLFTVLVLPGLVVIADPPSLATVPPLPVLVTMSVAPSLPPFPQPFKAATSNIIVNHATNLIRCSP
ncbi:hypothetical protein [Geotalea toluenoxydans]|uniref:hypothetical protein n=1 Tax=Geotalea toluenoxydans TaxID=421624 RepID=UPI001FB397B6|nr:hypothetical protein [Geotalea toluenoxydans]